MVCDSTLGVSERLSHLAPNYILEPDGLNKPIVREIQPEQDDFCRSWVNAFKYETRFLLGEDWFIATLQSLWRRNPALKQLWLFSHDALAAPAIDFPFQLRRFDGKIARIMPNFVLANTSQAYPRIMTFGPLDGATERLYQQLELGLLAKVA